MPQKKGRDFLIRNMPIEVYHLLEESAKEHHRSKTQEAILAIHNGLAMHPSKLKKPVPFKWKKKISSRFIKKAIQESRE
ncbi:MAG: TraY domain-containing protein [Waddliaceae bacterium]